MELDKRERWISQNGELFYGTAKEILESKNLKSYCLSNDEWEVLMNDWVHIYYSDDEWYPLRIESLFVFSNAQIEYLKPIFKEHEALIPTTTVADWYYTLFEKKFNEELEKELEEEDETIVGE